MKAIEKLRKEGLRKEGRGPGDRQFNSIQSGRGVEGGTGEKKESLHLGTN